MLIKRDLIVTLAKRDEPAEVLRHINVLILLDDGSKQSVRLDVAIEHLLITRDEFILLSRDEALKASQKASDRYYESELYRFKGELLLSDARRKVEARSKSRRKLLLELRTVLIMQSKLPGASKRSGLSFAQSLASVDCGREEAEQPTFVICCCRFITGSLKVSTLQIYWQLVHFSKP